MLIFFIAFLTKLGKTYGKTNGIQTKLLVGDVERHNVNRDSSDPCDALLGKATGPNVLIKQNFLYIFVF